MSASQPLIFAWAQAHDRMDAVTLVQKVSDKLCGHILMPEHQATVLCVQGADALRLTVPLALTFIERRVKWTRVLLGFEAYTTPMAYRYIVRDDPTHKIHEVPNPIPVSSAEYWINNLGPARRLLTQLEVFQLRRLDEKELNALTSDPDTLANLADSIDAQPASLEMLASQSKDPYNHVT